MNGTGSIQWPLNYRPLPLPLQCPLVRLLPPLHTSKATSQFAKLSAAFSDLHSIHHPPQEVDQVHIQYGRGVLCAVLVGAEKAINLERTISLLHPHLKSWRRKVVSGVRPCTAKLVWKQFFHLLTLCACGQGHLGFERGQPSHLSPFCPSVPAEQLWPCSCKNNSKQ